jgi:hypothetical protein
MFGGENNNLEDKAYRKTQNFFLSLSTQNKNGIFKGEPANSHLTSAQGCRRRHESTQRAPQPSDDVYHVKPKVNMQHLKNLSQTLSGFYWHEKSQSQSHTN